MADQTGGLDAAEIVRDTLVKAFEHDYDDCILTGALLIVEMINEENKHVYGWVGSDQLSYATQIGMCRMVESDLLHRESEE